MLCANANEGVKSLSVDEYQLLLVEENIHGGEVKFDRDSYRRCTFLKAKSVSNGDIKLGLKVFS